MYKLLLLELILKIFTVLNSIEIYQGGSNTDSGSRRGVQGKDIAFLYLALLSIYLNIDLSINNFLNMSRNIIGLSKLQNRRFSEAHVIYMASSLVFQSKELQTEPIIVIYNII